MCLVTKADEAKIVKVLRHLIDQKGRNSLNPSLFARDDYQMHLRLHPAEVAAERFDIQFKARNGGKPLVMKLEMRTSKTELGKVRVFEKEVTPRHWFSSWTHIDFDQATRQAMGEILAWRLSLWDGADQIAEEQSFLW
jgi:hypothetical protein